MEGHSLTDNYSCRYKKNKTKHKASVREKDMLEMKWEYQSVRVCTCVCVGFQMGITVGHEGLGRLFKEPL